jgi:hypothetical protein
MWKAFEERCMQGQMNSKVLGQWLAVNSGAVILLLEWDIGACLRPRVGRLLSVQTC